VALDLFLCLVPAHQRRLDLHGLELALAEVSTWFHCVILRYCCLVLAQPLEILLELDSAPRLVPLDVLWAMAPPAPLLVALEQPSLLLR